MKKQVNHYSGKLLFHWKTLAFLLPFYLVYGPFSADDRRPIAKTVWKYLLAGFVFYIIVTVVFLFTQKV